EEEIALCIGVKRLSQSLHGMFRYAIGIRICKCSVDQGQDAVIVSSLDEKIPVDSGIQKQSDLLARLRIYGCTRRKPQQLEFTAMRISGYRCGRMSYCFCCELLHILHD